MTSLPQKCGRRFFKVAQKSIVRILDLLTTMTPAKDNIAGATMELVNNLLIEVLGYMAEMELCNVRKWQEEGIILTREMGIKFGRKQVP